MELFTGDGIQGIELNKTKEWNCVVGHEVGRDDPTYYSRKIRTEIRSLPAFSLETMRHEPQASAAPNTTRLGNCDISETEGKE